MKSTKFSTERFPDSIDEAWENYEKSKLADAPQEAMPWLKAAFYRGGLVALHQANAGRYLETATSVNRELFRGEGLTEHEVIETVDQLLDGTFEHPPGVADGTPFPLKPL
jgi:hypothetical protein